MEEKGSQKEQSTAQAELAVMKLEKLMGKSREGNGSDR